MTTLVAVGDSGTLTTSPDGTTWTSRTSGFGTGSINGVAWSPSLSLFVAVGDSSFSGTLTTSPDGITWTLRTSGFGTGSINGVAWSPSLSLFVAVGFSGNFAKLTTSPDGITWTSRTSGFGTTIITGVASGLENVAPNAPILTSPASNATIDRAVTQRFAWTFSDPDAGDTQSAFSLRYRLTGAATWTTITGTTPNSFYDFAPATLAAGDYEWQVSTTDALGYVGPYSGSSFYAAADVPSPPTITAPINGSTVSAETATVAWSTPNQDAYEVRRVADNAGAADTGTVYFTTGVVESTAARSIAVAFPTNDRYEHVQVRVRDAGLWSPWSSVRVLVSYTPPAVPTLVVTGNTPTGAITIQATHPTPGAGVPTVTSIDIHRRLASDTSDGIRIAAGLAPSTAFADWAVASGVAYAYRVRALGSNGTSSWSAWSLDGSGVVYMPDPYAGY